MAIKLASLGQTLAEIRKRRGLTQRVLAERANLTVNFLSLVEHGERGISTDSLNDCAEALGVATEFIVFLAGDEDQSKGNLAKLSQALKSAILESISAESEIV